MWQFMLLRIYKNPLIKKIMDTMNQHIDFFHALSNEIRLRILLLLLEEPRLSVCQLVRILGLPQPKVSRHLAALRDAGVASINRRAQWVCYGLGETLEPWQRRVLEEVRDSLRETPQFKADMNMLMRVRKMARDHPCQPAKVA
jgi:ArsR family transcriptional regulator